MFSCWEGRREIRLSGGFDTLSCELRDLMQAADDRRDGIVDGNYKSIVSTCAFCGSRSSLTWPLA